MADYSIIDAEGRVISRIRVGRMADAEAAARRRGGTVFAGHVPPGHVVVDGVAVPMPDGVPSDALRSELKADVDFSAGQVRALFITSVPGQEMVYAEKRAEAIRILAGQAEGVPHLAAEAVANGRTLAEQAAIIEAMAAGWRDVSVVIETRRMAAKAAIDAAETESAARAAAAINWSDVRAMA